MKKRRKSRAKRRSYRRRKVRVSARRTGRRGLSLKVRYNRRHRRRSRRNGGMMGGGSSALSLRSPIKAALAGFNPRLLMKAGTVVGGALGNAWLSGVAAAKLPLPSFARSGIGSAAVGLLTAGILGGATRMVAPSFAGPVFLGGVIQVMTDVVKQYVMPLIAQINPLKGLGDYLTTQNVAQARPLGYMGDYLTTQNVAQARPLGYMGNYYGEQYIAEELAGI